MKNKTKKLLEIFVVVMMVMVMLPSRVHAADTTEWKDAASNAFAGGNGTQNSPYQIANAEQLAYFAKVWNDAATSSTYKDAYFELTNNIDLSAHVWNPIGEDSSASGKKVYFQGNFNGNDYKISGLTIHETDKPSYAGLFGYVKDSNIENLKIEKANMIVDPQGAIRVNSYAGLLAAYADNTTIKNVEVSGNIEKGQNVRELIVTGGFVGYAKDSTIDTCQSDITIKGMSNNVSEVALSGGFIGASKGSVITNSTTYGSITGAGQLGGFIADARETQIENCHAYVNIKATSEYVGGFVGNSADSTISNSYAGGDVQTTIVSNNTKTGGFVGNNSVDSLIQNCYFIGKMHETNHVGAFVGNGFYGTITDSVYDITKNPTISKIGYSETNHINEINAKKVDVYLVKVDGKIVASGKYNTKVTVTADETDASGKVFAGWELNGNIVSTTNPYTFYISNDVELKTIYAEESAKPEQEIGIQMTNHILLPREDGKADARFVGQIIVPEGCKVLEAGLYYSVKDTPNQLWDETIEDVAEDAKKLVAKGWNETTYQLSLTIKSMPVGRFVRGVIYAKVEDKDGIHWIHTEEQKIEHKIVVNEPIEVPSKQADYSNVDEALKAVPKDLSRYTVESVQALKDAINAVQEGKAIHEQETVNKYATDIMNSIEELVEKTVTQKENVDTSDNYPIIVFAIVALISIAGVVGLTLKKRK